MWRKSIGAGVFAVGSSPSAAHSGHPSFADLHGHIFWGVDPVILALFAGGGLILAYFCRRVVSARNNSGKIR